MKYYYEFFELNDERLSVSLAMIGDYDGLSGLPGYAMDPIRQVLAIVMESLQPKCWIRQELLQK